MLATGSEATHANIVTFVEQLNESVINIKLTDDVDATLAVEARRAAQEQRTKHILDQFEGIARQTPPIDNKSSRFRNPAFMASYDEVETKTTEKSSRRLPSNAELGVSEAATPELQIRGVTANTSTIETRWNSTSCVAFDERDHKSLVIRVFCQRLNVHQVHGDSMTTILVRFGAAADVHWTYEPARSNSGWGVKDHICSRREHGRLDVPSMLTMSFINRSYFSSVDYCCFCATIAMSNAPPDTEKSSFLTSTARSGCINMIVLIIGKGRRPRAGAPAFFASRLPPD
ncbi:hypothetical protein V8E55_011866 [Tylopilus felleus]